MCSKELGGKYFTYLSRRPDKNNISNITNNNHHALIHDENLRDEMIKYLFYIQKMECHT